MDQTDVHKRIIDNENSPAIATIPAASPSTPTATHFEIIERQIVMHFFAIRSVISGVSGSTVGMDETLVVERARVDADIAAAFATATTIATPAAVSNVRDKYILGGTAAAASAAARAAATSTRNSTQSG